MALIGTKQNLFRLFGLALALALAQKREFFGLINFLAIFASKVPEKNFES